MRRIVHLLNGDDDQDDCFFEMRIVVDEITKDVSIVVTWQGEPHGA
jgi:hypothetical protein